ncbi:MAG TPA: hypothetical protein VHT75_04225 [Acidimicrobiales bacterium]|nr:hypothetical protein [Acidimicrobiales bacterium]
MTLIGSTVAVRGPLPTVEELQSEAHACGDGWLATDRTDPHVSWCFRCGACLGQPGGTRPTRPLADTHLAGRGVGTPIPAESAT